VPITTTDFWNDLNKAIKDIETDPEPDDRDGIRQGTYMTLSALLDHYSGLWPQIRKETIDDLARHAMLIHAVDLRDAAGRHVIYENNPLRVTTTVSLREVLDRAALDKVTVHRILDIVSDAAIGESCSYAITRNVRLAMSRRRVVMGAMTTIYRSEGREPLVGAPPRPNRTHRPSAHERIELNSVVTGPPENRPITESAR
jgi:hypothetical protein